MIDMLIVTVTGT